MERALNEIASVALSAVKDGKSRKAQISWTPLNAVLGLTFRFAYILLSQMPGPSSPESTDKETFAGKDEC